jgi:hypothetical protein
MQNTYGAPVAFVDFQVLLFAVFCGIDYDFEGNYSRFSSMKAGLVSGHSSFFPPCMIYSVMHTKSIFGIALENRVFVYRKSLK